MATFSDMVTLLLAFFVMLVAMANFEDTRRVEAVVESIRTALGVNGFEPKLVGASTKTAFTKEDRRTQSLQPVVAKLREAFSKHVSDDFVRMVQNESELRVRLDDKVFFQSGSTTLHPSAYALIADLGDRLADEAVHIRVEGYADGTGSETGQLAVVRRACAVCRDGVASERSHSWRPLGSGGEGFISSKCEHRRKAKTGRAGWRLF